MTRTRPVVALVAATTVIGTLIEVDVRARPQQESADAPAFEVASVKPNISGQERVSFTYQRAGGRFNATNVTLRILIRNAYQLQDSQIVGDRAGSTRIASISSQRRTLNRSRRFQFRGVTDQADSS